MKIVQGIFNEIISHSKEGYPEEVCGLIAGTGGLCSSIYRMTNIDKSSVSYMMEPSEQFRAFKKIREEGLDLCAIYHSHPASQSYPSQTDVKLAFYPDVVYIIVSLDNPAVPVIKGFRISEERISEEALEVIP